MLRYPIKKFHACEKLLPYSDGVTVPAVLASTWCCPCKAREWFLKANDTNTEGKENEYLLRKQCQVKPWGAILTSVPVITNAPQMGQDELGPLLCFKAYDWTYCRVAKTYCASEALSLVGHLYLHWLAGSLQGVVPASQPQKSLSDVYYLTSSALALTLGKVVSLLDLSNWVRYLQEFVLSEWMLELMESRKAGVLCSLGSCGSWDLSSDLNTTVARGHMILFQFRNWNTKPFLAWGFCLKTVSGLYTFFHGTYRSRSGNTL